jgi:DNA replication licensing factor MCM4
MQTYIDCVHVKKADKGRMQAEDPMEVDNESGEKERDREGDTSDAANEAKVLGMPCFQFSF